MSPRRHGSHASVPSGARRATVHPSRSAVRTAPTTSAASASRSSSARALPSWGSAPSKVTAGPWVGAPTNGLERDVLGLRVRRGGDEVGEHVVHELDDRRDRAEVAGEVLRCGAERLPGAEERGDVGAPEPVDRLLGVADDEETPGLDGDLVPRPASRHRDRPMPGARRDRHWIGSVSWNSSSRRCV